MIFLNFLQLPKVFSAQIFQENTFLEIKLNFSLTGKYFLLTNFSNDKQTQKSKHFFGNQAKFFFTGKYFILINFSNSKQIQK